MKYMALVKGMDSQIEEEVTLEIEGVEFTGFALICPYKIELGKSYPVSIGFTILDELIIRQIKEDKRKLDRIGYGYKYNISGLLKQDSIDSRIVLTDEDEYFTDYPELIDKYVEMRVDRISIEFLRNTSAT